MAITPQNPGAIDTPNTLTPDSAGSVAVPNTLTPESAGSVAVPNTLTPESAGSVSVPNSLAAESAGSVAVPNTLNAETAGSVAVPNTLTASDAIAFPRTLTPTVDLNYGAGLFSQNGSADAESDLITFARASTGTFINRQLGSTGRWEYFLDTAASGVQRIEYDAATGENLGALIEQASTNLCLRSEEFDNGAWVKSNSAITANDAHAPDLTASADKFEAGSTGSIIPAIYHHVSSVTLGSEYTTSIFVKRSEAAFMQVNFLGGHVDNNPRVNFDLSSGTIGSQDADIDAASITPVGTDWFRVSCTVTAAAIHLRPYFLLIKSATDTRSQTNSWTAGDGLYIWGAQIEQVAVPTSYIPTTTAAVSRLADQVSIPVAGNVPSGDVTFHADVHSVGSSSQIRYVYDVATSAGNIDGFVTSNNRLASRHGGSIVYYTPLNDYEPMRSVTDVFNSSDNSVSGYVDAILGGSGDSGLQAEINTGSTVTIGSTGGFSAQLNGHIKRFTIYDEALTADEVAQL
jgi:hypothetical protein